MDSILVIIALSLAIATVVNIIFTKLSISHIIGYIVTGIIISNMFDFNGSDNLASLDLIGEFGIVFLMFTIGLEMSFAKLKKMKDIIFINGTVQVTASALIVFLVAKFLFNLDNTSAIIVALAFSLSSTAIVLTYLKKSKDINTPYGQKSVAILIFQDLAVIPVLLLISFLANDQLSVTEVLTKTILYAAAIILFMFTLGKKIIEWLLQFSTAVKMEEVFLGSVLTIVLCTSLLAHEMGFTYSLGAFIAGMIIAETHFHVKVESDIASYKDLLLGAFFFAIGSKIDILYFINNLGIVFGVLLLVMLIKAAIIYLLIRNSANKSDSIKSAFALCQVGEFSFAIFSLALAENIISAQLGSFLILVSVLSMIITPFMVNNIYRLAALFVTEFFEADKITPIDKTQHTIVCGFKIVGRIVAKELAEQNVSFIIISDNLPDVLLARERGYMAYFGHLEKKPVIESLNVEQTSAVILTMNSIDTKRLICESLLSSVANVNLIVKINTLVEKDSLADLAIGSFVHAEHETANLLVKESLKRVSIVQ
ncbi:cation:proton antiporter domain-containing protein [Thalassotalea sp. PLHSN55]|uniref:cation:proton antiporter domain-containing protein n=1 Tax=Thalassotalea sp. PLHSN55 TaxID=3435888 RepID=UPI003F83BF9D